MPAYVVLLRAVNVGGTGRLPMAELRAMCVAEGYSGVQTYIASGNVVLKSRASPKRIKAALECRLEAYAGKPVGVLVRTAGEMASILAANPFLDAPPNRVYTLFLEQAPPAEVLETLKGRTDEEVRPGVRELYVHYPGGMGASKLVIPAARSGTARNMNTVAKLAELAAGL